MSTTSSKRNTFIFLVTAACALAVDQVLKLLVVSLMEPGRSVTAIPHLLDITYSTNTGAAFGVLRGSGQLLLLAALVVVGLTLAWFFLNRHQESAWSFVALGLVTGGALGNIADRVFRGEVVDFIDLGWWPVFNFADVAIVAGVIMFVACTAAQIFKGEGGDE